MSEREQRFCVSDMSCSACSARVERAVGQLSGVRQVQVNLLTGSMLVRYDAEQTEQSIIHAVEAAGYGARVAQGKQRSVNTTDKSHALKQRFLLSLLLLLPLVAVHHAWHGEGSGTVQCLLSLPIQWLNRPAPTPAVSGFPAMPAREFLRSHPDIVRSCYAGYLGPVAENAAHLFVTLRCMQVFHDRCRLYAGGGLMPDSHEEAEWAETTLKMQAMAQLLAF